MDTCKQYSYHYDERTHLLLEFIVVILINIDVKKQEISAGSKNNYVLFDASI